MGDHRKTEQAINDILYKNASSNVPVMGFASQEMFNVHVANSSPKRTAMHVRKKETFLRPKKPKTDSDEGIFVTSFHLPSIWDLQSNHAKQVVSLHDKYKPPKWSQRLVNSAPEGTKRFVRSFKLPDNLQIQTQLARFQKDIHSPDKEKVLLSKKERAPRYIPGKPTFVRSFRPKSVADIKVQAGQENEAGRDPNPIGSQNTVNYNFREIEPDRPPSKASVAAAAPTEHFYASELALSQKHEAFEESERQRLKEEFLSALPE